MESESVQSPTRFNLSEMPWWAQLVYVVGVPSALVIFLTWFVTGGIDHKINQIVAGQQSINETIRLHSADTSYEIKELISMRLILQQICVNSAKESGTKTTDCFK